MTEWMGQMQLLANRSITVLERRADASRRAHAAAALVVRGPRAAAWAALLLSVCLGVATAFFRLGAKGLWGDEVWQVSWAQQQPLAQTFLRFRAPPDLPLHFLLTEIATAFADGAFWVRLPSALLGAATVLLIFLLGRRVFDTWTALSAAVVLAVAPYHVWYAQDARPYAALAFYALLSLYFYSLLLQRPSLGSWTGFTMATTLDLYNHLFGLFPLVVEIVMAAVWVGVAWVRLRLSPTGQRDDGLHTAIRSLAALAGGALTSIALGLPLLGGIGDYLFNQSRGEVVASFHLAGTSMVDVLGLFGSGRGWPFWLMAALFIVGAGAGVCHRRWFPFVAVAWLGLPFGILWLTQPHHVFIPRYVLFMQPVYLLIGAYGLTQVARTLTVAVATLLPLAGRTSLLGPLVCGALLALLAAVAAITFTPTWHSYRVEKINDWSAICAYLRKNVKPGDVMTGNAYTQGIMSWCFQQTTDVSFAPPGSYALAELDGSGRNVWYVLVGSSSPDAAFVRRHYTALPRGAWARRDLIPATSYGDRLIFPQAEFAATLYHYTATRIPRQIRFHDVHGAAINPSWPDYAQIGPGGRYDVRLTLRATAPRVLRIVIFRLAGRDLNVLLNRVLAARIRPHATSAGWMAVEIPVPHHVGDVFRLELQNPSSNVSAFSEVEVDYARASPRSARQHVAGAPPGRTGLTHRARGTLVPGDEGARQTLRRYDEAVRA